MKLWLIAIWNTIPRAWIIVALPFVLPLAALGIWWLVGGYFEEPPPARQASYATQLEQLLPAAESGDPAAQYRAGMILRDGLGGTRDLTRARAFIEASAKAGNPDARVALGKMYETGVGVRQDYLRAAELYRIAAGFDRHPEAQFALGNLYFHGRGVGNDYGEAISWYQKAARQGHAGAQAIMAAMYDKGWGVDENPVEAYVWYALAAGQPERARHYRPDIDPLRELRDLETRISRLDLDRAQERLRAVRRHIIGNAASK